MADEEDVNAMFEMGDESVSLSDIANLDVSDVKEVRMGILPKLTARFRVTKMELTSRNTKKQGQKPVLAGQFEVVEVHNCLDDEEDVDALVGRKHSEAWFIGVGDPPNPVEDIGRWKAFLTDTGFQAVGKTNQICENVIGHEFIATTQHRKDPNDSDITYCSFNPSKLKAYNPAEAAE